MKNEERWRTFADLIMETSQKRYGSASALIFSFLFVLTNFMWNMNTKGADPFPSALHVHL